MTASFPTSVKSFSTLVDGVDSVLASHQNDRALEITAIENYLIETPTEKTVSGGVLTVDKSRHKVQPESGTTDDIDTITGVPDGAILILYASDAGTDTLTLKNGTGNLSCFSGSDIELSRGFVQCFRSGSTVYVAGGGGGSGSATNGWNSSTGTWSYVSADSPSFVCNVPDADAALFSVGARFSLTQTTEKFFIVTAKGSPSGGYTPCTIYGGTDYTLANAAITSPKWSNAKAPYGFPLEPAKWTVTVTDTQDKQKTSPTTNTWYGGANAWSTGSNVTISVPIGSWRLNYSVYQYVLDTSATIATMETTLSTSNNSESDVELTASIGGNGASGTITVRQTSRLEKNITVASKTSYYLLARSETANMDDINIIGSLRSIIINAECAYL